MADVLLAYVREDAARAEALADTFDALGLSIGDANVDEREFHASCVRVIVWSVAASRSPSMVATAQRLIAAGDTLIASLVPADVGRVGDVPVFDLSEWSGRADDPRLDALLDVLRRVLIVAQPERVLEMAEADAAPALELATAAPAREAALALAGANATALPAPEPVAAPARETKPDQLALMEFDRPVVAATPSTRLERSRRRRAAMRRAEDAWTANVSAEPTRRKAGPARRTAAGRGGAWGVSAAGVAAAAFLAGVLLGGELNFDRPYGGPVATVRVPAEAAAAMVVEAVGGPERQEARWFETEDATFAPWPGGGAAVGVERASATDAADALAVRPITLLEDIAPAGETLAEPAMVAGPEAVRPRREGLLRRLF